MFRHDPENPPALLTVNHRGAELGPIDRKGELIARAVRLDAHRAERVLLLRLHLNDLDMLSILLVKIDRKEIW